MAIAASAISDNPRGAALDGSGTSCASTRFSITGKSLMVSVDTLMKAKPLRPLPPKPRMGVVSLMPTKTGMLVAGRV